MAALFAPVRRRPSTGPSTSSGEPQDGASGLPLGELTADDGDGTRFFDSAAGLAQNDRGGGMVRYGGRRFAGGTTTALHPPSRFFAALRMTGERRVARCGW